MDFKIPTDNCELGKLLALLASFSLFLSFVSAFLSIESGAFTYSIGHLLFLLSTTLTIPILFLAIFLLATKDFRTGGKFLAIGVILGTAIAFIWLMMYSRDWPSSMPPEVCTMPAGMSCAKAALDSDGGILQLTLISNLQKSIVVTSVTCTKKPDQLIRLLNTTMENAQAYTFLLNCNGENGELLEFAQGDAFSGKINVEYYFEDEGPSNKRTITGNIYVKAA
jgi:hypothetical protein